MMFLEKFWKGDIAPGEERYRPNREYARGCETMERCEAYMKEHLTPESWETFQKFADAALEVNVLGCCDNFIDGFRMGALMMMDVLMGQQRH